MKNKINLGIIYFALPLLFFSFIKFYDNQDIWFLFSHGKYILHNSYKSDVFSLGFCMLLAATLKVDSLYVIREIKDMIILSNEIHKFLHERYSENLINVIISMLEIEEKNRFDFIELEKIVSNL